MASLRDLKGIADQWEKNKKALNDYGDAFKKLGLSEKDSASLAQKAAKLDEDALKKKTDGLKKVADVLGAVRDIGKDAFSGVASGLSALTKGDVKGAMDGLVDSVAALASTLDLVYPGLGQAASALVKFAGGGASLMYDLAQKTVEENQKLLELKNTFDALGSNLTNTGSEMVEFFGELSRDLPQTRKQLADMAIPLLENGVQGDKLEKALRAQSAAAAMLGEHGSQAYASMAQKARDAQRNFQPLVITQKELLSTGLNTKDLAAKLGTTQEDLNARIRFGIPMVRGFGDALEQAMTEKGQKASKGLMSTLGVMLPKLQENIGKLFAFGDKDTTKGLDLFTSMFQKFANIFDDTTASGKMLHTTIHDIVDGTLAGAGEVLHGARRGFKMLEIVWMTMVTKADPLFIALGDLNKELAKSGGHGLTFEQALKGIGAAAEVAVKSLTALVKVTTEVMSIANKGQEIKGPAGGMVRSGMNAALGPVLSSILPGHATGGVVTGVSGGLATVRAADGEGLASIGRGERIVPANDTGSKGGWNVTLMPGAVVVQGGSSQSQGELTESAISLMFERIRLKQGLA